MMPVNMRDTPLAIGLDFGGTSIKAAVIYQNVVVDQIPPIATQEFDAPEPLIDAMLESLQALMARHDGIAALGVGVPGFVDFETGVVRRLTNVRDWQDVPLRRICSERLGIPVTVDNDANCMAYAEWKQGAGRGCRHLVCLTLGTGVGGGVIANGQMVRGAHFGAGEIGQTSIDFRGRMGQFGNEGALEDYIGNQEIAATAYEHYLAAGIHRKFEECTPQSLAHAAHRGDPVALAIWDEVARMLATAVMNCCWLLNPEAVIIGGGVARSGELLFTPLCEHLFRQLSGPFKDHLRVLPACFGPEAGIIGAASLALELAGHVSVSNSNQPAPACGLP